LGVKRPFSTNIFLLKFLALLVAAAVWLPCVHLFYKPDVGQYRCKNGVSSKARMVAARHLGIWTDPTLRRLELQKMQNRNPEWHFMSRTFFVLALANMALSDSEYKQQACDIIDAIIDNTIKLEQEKGFEHFLLSYGRVGGGIMHPPRSQFFDGEVALMLGARRLIEEKASYKPLLREQVKVMVSRMSRSPVLCAESYPDECWTFCNTVSLAAIRISDVLDGTDHSEFLSSWVDTASRKLIDHKSGLLISAFGVDGTPAGCGFGPEGSTIWMATHMLQIVNEQFATDQYRLAREKLGRSILGFGYSREWPVDSTGPMDIDSGPVVPFFGASASASGLAIVAAAAFDDTDYFTKLFTSMNFAAFPKESDGELRYQAGNPLGDAVVLYAMVQGPLWNNVKRRSGQ